MGRGPGRWQRVLLSALEDGDMVAVGGLAWIYLGRPATRSEEVAARRAARALVLAGRARAIYRMLPTADGARRTHQLVLTRPDSIERTDTVPMNCPEWVDNRSPRHDPLTPS